MCTISKRSHRRGLLPPCRCTAFTLVELLVVIAIIGVLVALLLPAVQAAREAARRAQCKNNIKNIALGCLLHVDSHGFLPSGGWGRKWSADPNQGYGQNQPGSWAYNILTYIEEPALHDMGKGLASGSTAYQNALTVLNQTPVSIFYCPSRRPPRAYIANWSPTSTEQSFLTNLSRTTGVAKTDYAMNSGASRQWDTFDAWFEPASYAEAETGKWSVTSICDKSKSGSTLFSENYAHCQTGVSYYRSQVKLSMITDGTSSTYLVGEKYLWPDGYENPEFGAGLNLGENQGVYSGMEWDNHRVAYMPSGTQYPPSGGSTSTSAEYYQPRQDTPGYDNNAAFGSAHPGGLNMSFCDGSVQTVSYDIDGTVHRYLAMRFDGEVATLP